MKIALISPTDLSGVGGVETHLRALYREFTRQGHTVHLVVGGVDEELTSAWCPLGKWSPEGYDIYHVHQSFPPEIRPPQIPRGVFTYHGCVLRKRLTLDRTRFFWRWLRSDWVRWAMRDDHRGGRWARKVICVDRATQREVIWLHGVPSRKISVIPNGHFSVNPNPQGATQIRRDLGLPEGAFVFLFVGRYGDPQKKPSAALAAFQQFLDRGHQAYLVMVPGDPQTPLGQQVISTGPQPVDRMPLYYDMADACVMTSVWEGFPVVLPEAMAAGLPFLGTRVGGIPDIVKHEFNGLIVPRNCQGLTTAMERVFLDPQLRKILSQGAQETAKDFTWERVARETEALYIELLFEKGEGNRNAYFSSASRTISKRDS